MNKLNKLKLIISSILILLPSAVALFLKDSFRKPMLGAWYFTWIMPLFLLAMHFLCIFITLRDNKHTNQSKKILNMTYWILPVMSIYISGIFMALGLGLDFNVGMVICILVGLSFILIGNYLPKTTRNRTFGIKLTWTISNDSNWAATHRFSGKLWVIIGALTMLLAFIPFEVAIIAFVALLVVAVIPPVIYSYIFYKRQIESGEATKEDYTYHATKTDKNTRNIALSIVGVISVLVIVLMFTGNIDFNCTDDALVVKPAFGGGMTIEYSELDADMIEYRDEKVDGYRVAGYGSSKLLYGAFRNEEFGNYTRYTYAKCEAAIVIHWGDEIVVLADETPELTYALYEELLSRID